MLPAGLALLCSRYRKSQRDTLILDIHPDTSPIYTLLQLFIHHLNKQDSASDTKTRAQTELFSPEALCVLQLSVTFMELLSRREDQPVSGANDGRRGDKLMLVFLETLSLRQQTTTDGHVSAASR